MTSDAIGIIRLMHHQNCGFSRRNVLQRRIHVGCFPQHIVNTAQPETRAIGFDWRGLIRENSNSLRLKRSCDAIRISECVVVPHHSPNTVRSFQVLKDCGAGLGVGCTFRWISPKRHRNEISRQQDELRSQSIHNVDRRSNRMNREIRIVMEVAE